MSCRNVPVWLEPIGVEVAPLVPPHKYDDALPLASLPEELVAERVGVVMIRFKAEHGDEVFEFHPFPRQGIKLFTEELEGHVVQHYGVPYTFVSIRPSDPFSELLALIEDRGRPPCASCRTYVRRCANWSSRRCPYVLVQRILEKFDNITTDLRRHPCSCRNHLAEYLQSLTLRLLDGTVGL